MSINEKYGKNFLPFVGIVVEVDSDNLRARVRIFGVHNMEDTVNVSDGDLPQAIIAYPVNAQNPHTLEIGTWVHGFFSDGDDCQQPVIVGQFGTGYTQGSYPGYPGGGGNFSGEYPTVTDDYVPQVDSTKTLAIPGGSRLEKAYNYIYNKLVSNNLSSNPKMHTSAFLGVIMLETYNVQFAGGPANDLHTGPGKGPSRNAWGICQWQNPRKAQLFRRYGQTRDLGDQLDFMWWELMNTESRARKKWLAATSLVDATAAAAGFERNEAWDGKRGRVNRSHKIFRRSYEYATQVYNTMTPKMYSNSPELKKYKGKGTY